ncbi:MAG: MurR/RpiR family transcriptional regulator [Oscillospiraceae bacterium]|nr:MurR/RpiR family transcriptional regulator [Oscillospiraceae bacterium]
MAKNILHIIEKNMIGFSKGQKLIAHYILGNYDKAAFMTASKLGSTVQVSESTVVRFASQLGYDGYPAMQRALQEMIRGKLTSIQRIEANDASLSGGALVSNVLQRDMERIRLAIDQVESSEFEQIVDLIANAQNIYIFGVRSSSFLAGYLNFYFRLLFRNVTLIEDDGAGMFDQIFRVGEGDVFISICFPRYSKLTLKSARFARERGASVIGITDSEMSPLYQTATASLLVRNEMISFVDSLAAPMSLLNAVILAVSQRCGNDLSKNFSALEDIWRQFDIFDSADE